MLILSAKINDFPYAIINAHLLRMPVNSCCTCQHAMTARRQVLITEIPGSFFFFPRLLLGLRTRGGNESTEMWPPRLVSLAISLLAAAFGCVHDGEQGQACMHAWDRGTPGSPQYSGQETKLGFESCSPRPVHFSGHHVS